MRIAQFTTTMDGGGAETMMLNLSEKLLKKGHIVTIYAFENSWIALRAEEIGLHVHPLDEEFKKVYSIHKLFIFSWKLAKLLKVHKIDTLHSHVYGATLRGGVAAFFAGIRHVATQHDNYTIEEKPLRTKWLNIVQYLGTHLILLSDQMFTSYKKHGLCIKRCSIIHNGVDTFKFIPEEYSTEQFTFITVGRLEKVKGYDMLLKAFKDVNGKLLIVGNGPERSSLENLSKELNLEEKVDFLGERKDIPQPLNKADAYICSSHSEGLSISILEAMSCGLPIVATNVGANTSLVQTNGLIVQPNNIEQLNLALSGMTDSTFKQIQNMGRDSRNIVLKYFSLETMVNMYIDRYTEH